MINFYIDESGSLTHSNNYKGNKYFIIALLKVNDINKLKRKYKRFVSSNLQYFKDKNNLMFRDNAFSELKGSSFTPFLKEKFIEYFSKDDNIELFYVKVDNSRCTDKLLENKARAFNFILKSFFIELSGRTDTSKFQINLQIDERNLKTNAKYFLNEYLNTELCLNDPRYDQFVVEYYQSENNNLIQIADVFSNIYFSNLINNGKYEKSIDILREKGILKLEYTFPTENP